MTVKYSLIQLRASTVASLFASLATSLYVFNAVAAETYSVSNAQPVQTVVSVLPEVQARMAIVSDSSWTSADNSTFTGKVALKFAFRQSAPASSYAAYVRFERGARTFWHMHPLGQTLIVVEGTGLTQAINADGTLGPVTAVKPGDVVICPPGITHWHGASPDSSMTHLAISELDPKKSVVWKEAVSAKSYVEGAKNALSTK